MNRLPCWMKLDKMTVPENVACDEVKKCIKMLEQLHFQRKDNEFRPEMALIWDRILSAISGDAEASLAFNKLEGLNWVSWYAVAQKIDRSSVKLEHILNEILKEIRPFVELQTAKKRHQKCWLTIQKSRTAM